MLLQQPGGFKPAKLFSIDRVFRNESLDATHLAEFHQIEGVVADYGLGLGDLIGTITEFFSRVGTSAAWPARLLPASIQESIFPCADTAAGIKDIKLKSAYNPYTEPSMVCSFCFPWH